MASVQKSDIPEISEFMSDIWSFMKSFWIPEDNEEYWMAVKDASSKILDKHQHDFGKAGVCFVLEYLKWKSEKESKETEYDFNTWLYMERVEILRMKIEEELGKKIKLTHETDSQEAPKSEQQEALLSN